MSVPVQVLRVRIYLLYWWYTAASARARRNVHQGVVSYHRYLPHLPGTKYEICPGYGYAFVSRILHHYLHIYVSGRPLVERKTPDATPPARLCDWVRGSERHKGASFNNFRALCFALRCHTVHACTYESAYLVSPHVRTSQHIWYTREPNQSAKYEI